MKHYLAIALCILVFASCSARQEIFLASDGSARLSFRVELSDYLYDYIEGLGSLNRKSFDKNDPFGVPKIREEIGKVGQVKVSRLNAISPKVLEGEFTCTDVEAFAKADADDRGIGIVSFTTSGNKKTLSISISRETLLASKALAPVRENELFQMFGPFENEGMSEDEYLEMMEWVLTGDGAKMIKTSFVDLEIVVPSSVLSQKGGTVKGRVVTFRIPLIDLLLLNEPLLYTVTYS